MSLPFTIVASARESFETPVTGTQEVDVDHVTKVSTTIPAECSAYVVHESFPITNDALQGLLLVLSGAATITFYDCDDAQVGQIEACAAVSVFWYYCMGFEHGITGDVAYMTVDNASEDEITLVGRIGYNDSSVCPSP